MEYQGKVLFNNVQLLVNDLIATDACLILAFLSNEYDSELGGEARTEN